MAKTKPFTKIGDILIRLDRDEDKYISREFQKYGYDLANELGDLKNKSLYIKLAKETPRALLESARSFVKDAYNAKSKPRLFMWRLQQLKKEIKSQRTGNKSREKKTLVGKSDLKTGQGI